MATQSYETDALQVHPDSTPILVERLENWRHTVQLVHSYAQNIQSTQNSITSGLDKSIKLFQSHGDIVGGGRGGETIAVGSGTSNFDASLTTLKRQTEQQLTESESASASIKGSVVPVLESLLADIEKHYKSLNKSGSKGIKDIEKSRDLTQKYVERLGRFTSSYGSTRFEARDDPYVVNRRIQASIHDQVARENTQAEAALSVQNSFLTLEQHIVAVLQQAFASLAEIEKRFYTLSSSAQLEISTVFNRIEPQAEWQDFSEANKDQLVPTTNYQRDPRKVVYSNRDHDSVQPLIEGILSRKGTVLRSWNQSFYVVTPSGYLHQFKSDDPISDATPELSLYLPESQVGALDADGQFTISSKDATKKLSVSHKYVFKAETQKGSVAWYRAVINAGAFDESAALNAGAGETNPATRADQPAGVEPPVGQERVHETPAEGLAQGPVGVEPTLGQNKEPAGGATQPSRNAAVPAPAATSTPEVPPATRAEADVFAPFDQSTPQQDVASNDLDSAQDRLRNTTL